MELKDMKELIKYFDKSDLAELEIEDGSTRLYISKNPVVSTYSPAPIQYTAPQPASAVTAAPAEEDKTTENITNENIKIIESPIIGTYYSAASPGAAPFARVGDIVDKGHTLCIIEAMKIMNSIEAEYRCKILEMKVENGKPVEFGQPIFVVEPQ